MAAVAGCLVAASAAHASLIVAPGAQAGVEGNSNNAYPFSLGGFPATARYQQIFGAPQFSSLSGPVLITQIAFRPDSLGGNTFHKTLSNVQINLSTSTANPEALSTTFANNVGADNTVVRSGGLALSSANAGSGPKNFDIIIMLSTPFLYNPANGSLLMDVRNSSVGTPTQLDTTTFDAENTVGDGVSRLYSGFSGSVNSTTGIADSIGLVTQFTFTPVPEPSTYLAGALLLLPFVGTTLRSLRNRKQTA